MVDVLSAELSVRAARAEIERDEAIARARRSEDALYAILSNDKEQILDTLHIIGIPARDIADIYRVHAEWQKNGGRESLLNLYRELFDLRAKFATATTEENA